MVNMIACARRKGLIVKLAPGRTAIELAPPLIIKKKEIDRALQILDEVITGEEKEMDV